MIKINLVWIAIFCVYILVFIGFGVVSLLIQKNQKQLKFSFLRTFPYEFINVGDKSSRFYKVLSCIFGAMCFSPLFIVAPASNNFGNLLWIAILVSCLFGFCGLLLIALHIIEAKFIKAHSVLFTLFACLVFFTSSLTGLFSLLVYNVNSRFNSQNGFLTLFCCILSFVFAVAVLFLILNPKLKDWTRLEKIKNSDGTISYDRPKIFPLALSEWLLIATLFIVELLFFLSLV